MRILLGAALFYFDLLGGGLNYKSLIPGQQTNRY
jgi:hypothetical protein